MSERAKEQDGQILVVDDDEYSRMWARRWLEAAGFTVREGKTVREALEAIAQSSPDLILLDVLLPDGNGIDLTRDLRRNPDLETTPILLMTVLEDAESKVRGLEAGANDFLTKLPDQTELVARVRTWLRLRRNLEELRREKDKTTLLYRISRELNAAMDLDSTLSRVLETTIRSTGVSRGSLILLDEQGAILRHIYSFQGEIATVSEVVRGRIVEKGLAGWVIRNRQAVIVPDTEQDPRWLELEARQAPAGSALCVPLIHQEKVVGVLTLIHREKGRFSPADLDLVQTIASQAAIALVKARLYEEIEQERGRLKAILNGSSEPIIVTDGDLRITLLNPAAEQAFGISLQEAAGRPLEEAIPLPPLLQAFRQAQEGEPSPATEVPLPDGRTLFFSVSFVPAGPQGEGGWVAVMQDITYIKAINQMKNEFVSTVSHDLRTPLSTIHGYGEVLLRMIEDRDQERLFDGPGAEIARRVMGNARRLTDLVEELLDLGKIESGVEVFWEPCDLADLTAQAVEGARFQAGECQIDLRAEIAPLLRPVLGNPIRLRQVLDNLIQNALKYTPAGGMVTVRAREKENRVVVTVEDSGIGIPREALPRVFEKFYRVPHPGAPRTAGIGLGLAIVKAVVEQHSGQVWVESEPGQGSTFGFSIPCVGQEEPCGGCSSR